MRLQIELTEQDFADYISFYFKKHPAGRRILRNNDIALAWVCLMGFLLLVLMGFPVFGAVAMALFFVGGRSLTRWLMRRRTLKMFRADRNSLYHLPSVVELTSEAIVRENELMYTRVSWKAVETVLESPGHILIYLGSAIGSYIVPVRCFDTPGEAAAFAEMARQYHQQASSNKGDLQ